MVRSLSNDELASRLIPQQVDRVVLDEAARRLREVDLRQLLHTTSIVEAFHQSPLFDRRQSEIAEKLILSVPLTRQSSGRLSSLASRILRGEGYTHQDVLSLAASVLSQDETPGN